MLLTENEHRRSAHASGDAADDPHPAFGVTTASPVSAPPAGLSDPEFIAEYDKLRAVSRV